MKDVLLAAIVFSCVSITLLALWDYRNAKAGNASKRILALDIVAVAASVVSIIAVIVVWTS